MKQLTSWHTVAFVAISCALFVLTLTPRVPVAKAAPPAPRAPSMSSTHFAIDWFAVANSDGTRSSSTHYNLRGTIGQMAASSSSASTNYSLCSGLQCVLDSLRLYLPLIMR